MMRHLAENMADRLTVTGTTSAAASRLVMTLLLIRPCSTHPLRLPPDRVTLLAHTVLTVFCGDPGWLRCVTRAVCESLLTVNQNIFFVFYLVKA